MVITNIIGGLGNQMFQYAAGRSLALARTQPLYLDISGFGGYGLHWGFELQNVFRCEVPIASVNELQAVLGWRSTRKVRRILARPELKVLRGKAFVVEPYFHYWPGFKRVQGHVYLQGYWQSERYFSDVAESIRTDFTFHRPLSEINTAVSEKIDTTQSAVSLHIRRGDYVSNPRTYARHGLCSIDYYHSAVRYIAERVSDPVFFVFSDDASWAKINLQVEYPCHYINHNRGAESYNDMRLMSLCHHHIIANSSFSWWGAWLNPSDDKIVIAPKRWFASGDKITEGVTPANWIRV